MRSAQKAQKTKTSKVMVQFYIKRLGCLVLVFLLLSYGLPAQSIIKGKIVDATSNQPLEGVTISVTGAQPSNTLSDQSGNFVINAPSDSLAISFSHLGYAARSASMYANRQNRVELTPALVDLNEIVLLTNNLNRLSNISRIDLALKPVKSTQELLRVVPGLFIAQHAGGGKAEQIFLRGFDCDHGTDVQVIIDAMPVNMVSHAHGQGYADGHFIIPETIQTVDYGAGPYYTAKGNLNTAGWVEFSTFNNIEKSRVQLEAGRFGTMRALFMLDLLKKAREKQSAYLAVENYYSNGPTLNKQHLKRFNLFGKYNLALSTRTELTATLSSFKSSWDASGQVPERAVASGMIDCFGSIDPSEGGNTQRHNANVIVSHQFSNQAKWENQFYFSRYKFDLYSNFTFYLRDTVIGDGINQAETRNLYGFQSTFDKRFIAGNWLMHSRFGTGVRYDAVNDSKLTRVVKRQFLGYTKWGDVRETNLYAYAQQDASIGKWFLDAGIRVDQLHFAYIDKLDPAQAIPRTKAILSPKLNIQYTVSQKLQLFMKTGKGFHSNDARVVVANNGQEVLPAAYGYDLGFAVKPGHNLFLSFSAWNLWLDQEFVYVGDEGIVEPSGKTKRQGLDLVARYQFHKNLFATVNLNFTKPRAQGVSKGQDHIPLAPLITSTGGLFYKRENGWNGSLSYRYISDRPANEDNTIVAKGYTLLDAAINYTKPGYEMGIAIENLLGVKWNEAQFATESRLMSEPAPVTELHFTPGTPFFIKMKLALFF